MLRPVGGISTWQPAAVLRPVHGHQGQRPERRLSCRYSYLDAAGTGPHALVDELGAPATRIHVYASPWDLASERFESVKFGVLGAIGAAFE